MRVTAACRFMLLLGMFSGLFPNEPSLGLSPALNSETAFNSSTAGLAETGEDGPMVGIRFATGQWDMTFATKAGEKIRLQTKTEQWSLPSPIVVQAREGVIKVSGRSFDTEIRFHAESGALFCEGMELAGKIECWKNANEGWDLFERTSLEKYLPGVVDKEVSANSFPMAALKAQAVAARTYALFQILTRPGRRWHVHSSTRSQVYQGVGGIDPKILEAVEETRGQALMTGGAVFDCFFHSTCGGVTCSGETGYNLIPMSALSSVDCDGCRKAPFYRWKLELAEPVLRSAVARVAGQSGIRVGTIRQVIPVDVSDSGYVPYLRIVHDGGSLEINTRRLRASLGKLTPKVTLRSSAFEVSLEKKRFVFHGRGWGHGVGMCQHGAKGYAKSKTYEQILQHYYRGTELRTLW